MKKLCLSFLALIAAASLGACRPADDTGGAGAGLPRNACGGDCATCSDGLDGSGDVFCSAPSNNLFVALRDCACSGSCAEACAGDFCKGSAPAEACLACLTADCGPQFDACDGDC